MRGTHASQSSTREGILPWPWTLALLVTLALTAAACGLGEGEATSSASHPTENGSGQDQEGSGEPEEGTGSGDVTPTTVSPPPSADGGPTTTGDSSITIDPPATEVEPEPTTTTAPPPPSVPQPDHHWSFDGDVTDQVAGLAFGGLDGVYGSGYAGRAVVFTAEGDSGNVQPQQFPTDGRPFTVAAWVYPTKDDFGTIISQVGGTDAAGDFAFRTQSGNGSHVKLLMWRREAAVPPVEIIESGLVVPQSTWSHVVAVYGASTHDGGTNMRLYVNGQEAPGTVSRGNYTGHEGDALTRIGTSERSPADAATQYQWAYAGSIDELMIFDRALSGDEIATMYANYGQYL